MAKKEISKPERDNLSGILEKAFGESAHAAAASTRESASEPHEGASDNGEVSKFSNVMRRMKGSLIVLLILPILGSPLSAAGPNVWFEMGGGPWLPMFGSLRNDHNPGVQGRLRIGYDGQFSISPSLKRWFPPLSLFSSVYPFVDAYHSYNRLKVPESGTEYGNVAFVGVGGRVLNTTGRFRYGAHLSLGLLAFYTLNRYSPAGFVGLYGQWDLRRFYLYAEYNLETSVDLRSSYDIDTSLTFLQRSSGWHEVSLGIGFRLSK